MADDDRTRWDARHATVTDDVPMPPDELRGRLGLLPDGGRALDVACGRGGVAAWLAVHGFTVDAVDVSPVALAAAATLARRHGVGERVRCWVHDLDTGLPQACGGPYDLVVCQRFRDPRLYPELAGRVRTGGVLVVTVLSEVGDDPGPWRAAAGELRTAFEGWVVLAEREGDGTAGVVLRPGPPVRKSRWWFRFSRGWRPARPDRS